MGNAINLSINECSFCGATFALLKPKLFNFCSIFHKRSFLEKNPELISSNEEMKSLYRWGNKDVRQAEEDWNQLNKDISEK